MTPMDSHAIQRLNAINKAFYEQTAPHFHDSRSDAWAGWLQLLPFLPDHGKLRVLDLGCGNGRFGSFLAENLSAPIQYHGVDNNAQLLHFAHETLSAENLTFSLKEQDILEFSPSAQAYDLITLFGVIHHVPDNANRQNFLKRVANGVAPNGLLVVASWRFWEFDRFKERVAPWPDGLEREENDFLLDWRRGTHALRYCHYIDDVEQDSLVASSGFREIARFRADGKTNTLNLYSLLKNEAS